jgi:hypothetical protein
LDRFEPIRRAGCGTLGILTGLAFLFSLASWLPHTLLAPFVAPQHIERPTAGFAVSLPLDWEFVDAADAEPEDWYDPEVVDDVQAHHEEVVADGGLLLARTRSPFAFHSCVLYDFSARAADQPAWTSLDHVPTDARDWTTDSAWAWDVQTTSLQVRAGHALRADVRWADGWKSSHYYYMEGTRWFLLECVTEDRPPDDRWLSIAETLEFLPLDVAEPAPQRIERPEAGFATTFPWSWRVEDAEMVDPEDWYDPEAVDDVAAIHAEELDAGLLLKARALLPHEPTYQVCDLYDITSLAEEPPAWTSLGDVWRYLLSYRGDPDVVRADAAIRGSLVGVAQRGRGFGPVAVTSRCGTQSSTWWNPSSNW